VRENADNKLDGNLGHLKPVKHRTPGVQIAVSLRRMFSSLAGMPLSEYVRRRRMTFATAEVVLRDTWLARNPRGPHRAHPTAQRRSRVDPGSGDPSYLYSGSLLEAADETAIGASADPSCYPPLSDDGRDFLQTSRRAHHRRRSGGAPSPHRSWPWLYASVRPPRSGPSAPARTPPSNATRPTPPTPPRASWPHPARCTHRPPVRGAPLRALLG